MLNSNFFKSFCYHVFDIIEICALGQSCQKMIMNKKIFFEYLKWFSSYRSLNFPPLEGDFAPRF